MAPKLAGEMTAKAAAAYVTFLAGDGDNWKGVVGLAKGLRKVGSAYPLVVAVLPDVPEAHRRMLTLQGCIVREIEPVYPPENQAQFAMAYYDINYSKLRIWEFVEYERMVYLDADIQVLENMDELFELDKGHFYAFADGKLGPPPPALYFDAGMFVHEPSMATAKALLDTLRVTPPIPLAEQDFLNMFFRDQFKPIPKVYNLAPAIMLGVQLEEVKVVRYIPDNEAYVDREDMEMLVKKRWGVDFIIKGLPSMPADAGEVGEKLPGFGYRLAEAKDVIFTAGKNLPAVATLVASSAAAGVVAAAATPPICFGFYAVFVAAMAVVIISLRRM
ncbi:unnamed protein product [Urochloa decumbens]|uniref:Hexosyltransferase n=1 Tax=Urochloa decumbens TaxID=240449 RepID=A0ABC9BBD3_9POAL